MIVVPVFLSEAKSQLALPEGQSEIDIALLKARTEPTP
jgi:hypothetical protein